MNGDVGFASMYNGAAIPRCQVPEVPFDDFRKLVIKACAENARVSAFFGHPDSTTNQVMVYVVLSDTVHGQLYVGKTRLPGDQFASLTLDCPQVHLFEREIAEQFGVVPHGHPWLKPVRFHESYRPGHDAWGRPGGTKPTVGVMDYYRVDGEEIHEVAVGPVHAGVIEPGHFRFQCHGEHVFHLEISLGYQHRGAERSLIGGPGKRTIHTMETVAGDTSIGHATAYCLALEALAGGRVPARAEVLRGIALELERLANHTGDLGALANDVAYLPTASFCGRLRGDFLNLTALICGSRFGRGLVRPGGVGFDLDDARREKLAASLDSALRDVAAATNLLWNTTSVEARFEQTGVVPQDVCHALGFTGPTARSCGVEVDVRHDFPWGIYRFTQIPVSSWKSGDVFARAFVRWLEIERSVAFIQGQLSSLPGGPIREPLDSLKPDHLAVALVEGWRGEICHVVLTNPAGKFERYKIVDPSFHNWPAVAMALRNQQISDFPLCNKSFNLSYCGHDL